jgi:hypothetical protein
MTKGFTRKPKPAGPRAVEDFIAAAGQPPEVTNDMKSSDTVSDNSISNHIISNDIDSFSWLDPKVRDDVQKVYNLRLPEPYLLKLKYIAERTPRSMQRVCLDALLPAIDAEIEVLTKGKG